MEPNKRQTHYIYPVGNLSSEGNQYLEFDFKLPSHYKRLVAVNVISNSCFGRPTLLQNVELSVWVNNHKTSVGNHIFALGYHSLDDITPRHLIVNQEIIPNNEINGFVKYLDGTGTIDIQLLLTLEE